jgi:hypothetical protein
MSEDIQEEMLNLVPKKIAFVVDNMVVDVLHTDERLAVIFLSQPLVLDVTETYEESQPMPGYVYYEDTQTFLPQSPDPSYVWNEEYKSWLPPIDVIPE